ncbi:protein canopy homolog 4 isoform X2 [Microcebus murinus]|uniref:protein canopy homolog 4 isoform X2 n=1 Tax=Microcebus murinus TaxID=30608 RepID=UPI003F6B5942
MGPVRLGLLLFILAVYGAWAETPKDDDDTERLPSKCEVCKLLSTELQEELSRTGRSREVLELGQVLDTGKRKRHVPYSVSETRLEEALENLCERILDYSVHAERKGSLRYAKGQSQTMATLKGLVQKGVKVDLGIPLELWDEPSVEVTFLKKQPFHLTSVRQCWRSLKMLLETGTSTIRSNPYSIFSVKVMCSQLLKLHVYRKLGLERRRSQMGKRRPKRRRKKKRKRRKEKS